MFMTLARVLDEPDIAVVVERPIVFAGMMARKPPAEPQRS
tara:strand:- start:679 stop:798 length:120 start_codon:yes stop_codon:yes gene_type:complete